MYTSFFPNWIPHLYILFLCVAPMKCFFFFFWVFLLRSLVYCIYNWQCFMIYENHGIALMRCTLFFIGVGSSLCTVEVNGNVIWFKESWKCIYLLYNWFWVARSLVMSFILFLIFLFQTLPYLIKYMRILYLVPWHLCTFIQINYF